MVKWWVSLHAMQLNKFCVRWHVVGGPALKKKGREKNGSLLKSQSRRTINTQLCIVADSLSVDTVRNLILSPRSFSVCDRLVTVSSTKNSRADHPVSLQSSVPVCPSPAHNNTRPWPIGKEKNGCLYRLAIVHREIYDPMEKRNEELFNISTKWKERRGLLQRIGLWLS